MSSFPRPPSPTFLDAQQGATTDNGWGTTVVPPSTACKHGDYGCELCGTTDRRDALHTTRGGRGVVGRLGRKRMP